MPVTEHVNRFFPPDKSTAITEVHKRSNRLLLQTADISMTLIQKRLLEIQNSDDDWVFVYSQKKHSSSSLSYVGCSLKEISKKPVILSPTQSERNH